MEDSYGFTSSHSTYVYQGEVESIVDFGVFVRFDFDRKVGLVHYSKIPGCKSHKDLKKMCKIGDKIKVRIQSINYKKGQILLDCVEFPVENHIDPCSMLHDS